MRIFPVALIVLGILGVLKYFGLIDPAYVHLFWPLLLIVIGLSMLLRGPRWHTDMHDRMQDRWERRLIRRFGPGWANLSEEERERFRTGMQQWHEHGRNGGRSACATPASNGASRSTSGDQG